MCPNAALTRSIEHRELFHEEMLSLMRQIMSGAVSPTLIAAIITGLRVKKETIGEIAAAAQVMREYATKVPMSGDDRLVDTCGTGGDSAHTFNISTAAAFVAAAAGAKVAKHGGRSVSSKSGSADVLEALGANINLAPEQVARSIAETGVGFMFAPNYHSAMKHAAPIRKELGMRPILNILGPLTHPAGAPNQVMGLSHSDLVGIQARVLKELGSKHEMVVYGEDRLHELPRPAQLTHHTLTPVPIGSGVKDVSAQRGIQRCHRLASVLSSRASSYPQEPKPGSVPRFVLRREVRVVVHLGVNQTQRDEPPVHRVLAPGRHLPHPLARHPRKRTDRVEVEVDVGVHPSTLGGWC